MILALGLYLIYRPAGSKLLTTTTDVIRFSPVEETIARYFFMWRIAVWSKEKGEGVIQNQSGESIPFDASVALVDDFFANEEVSIELQRSGNSWKVSRIEPTSTRFQPRHKPTRASPPLKNDLAEVAQRALDKVILGERYSLQSFGVGTLRLEGQSETIVSLRWRAVNSGKGLDKVKLLDVTDRHQEEHRGSA
ncbi:hypothetical protein SCOR_10225 [Sulfidibacter corallicola]